MAEDFGDADDGEILGIDDGVAAGGAHALAADAEELERRIAAAQGFDQLRAVHFPRSFTGGDQDSQESIVRLGPRTGLVVGRTQMLPFRPRPGSLRSGSGQWLEKRYRFRLNQR